MKKYIFLGQSILGNGGGQIYLLNKKIFLESIGYDVSIYSYHTDGEILYEDFKKYKNMIFPEFQFGLSYFRENTIQKTLKKVISFIDKSQYDEIVIESNWIGSAEWGELIASKVGAKHIIYLLSEHNNRENSLDFLKYKHAQKEISAISETVIREIFDDTNNFSLNEYSVISAGCFSLSYPQNISCSELECIFKNNDADFTVSYFGRLEKLKNKHIEEIQKFANKYNTYKVLFIAMGYNDSVEICKYKSVTDHNPKNLDVKFVRTQIVIPKMFFNLSDIVIASAGCAVISSINKKITISMEVNTGDPIGVLGITTKQTTFSQTVTEKSLCEMLEDVLIKKLYFIKDIDMSHVKSIHSNAKKTFIEYAGTFGGGNYYDFEKSRRIFKLNKSELRRFFIRLIGINNVILYRNLRYK